MESPLVIGHVKEGLDEIRRASAAFDLPVVVAATAPSPDQTFWVNLIGRGYPSPNRSFRWCTDRMKILPTSRYIRNQASLAGEVILLLGVRRSESATRAGVVARYDNFDGEQVQRYAGRDMSKQVRDGIEGLLGLPVLRVLKDSLEKYAQNRRTRSAKPSDKRVNAVKSAIEELENRIERRKAQRDEADAHLSALQNASSTPRKRSLARSAPSSEGTCRASGGVPPDLDNAARADAYTKLIGDLLEEAVSHEVDEVATEMTSAWKAISRTLRTSPSGPRRRSCPVRCISRSAKRGGTTGPESKSPSRSTAPEAARTWRSWEAWGRGRPEPPFMC